MSRIWVQALSSAMPLATASVTRLAAAIACFIAEASQSSFPASSQAESVELATRAQTRFCFAVRPFMCLSASAAVQGKRNGPPGTMPRRPWCGWPRRQRNSTTAAPRRPWCGWPRRQRNSTTAAEILSTAYSLSPYLPLTQTPLAVLFDLLQLAVGEVQRDRAGQLPLGGFAYDLRQLAGNLGGHCHP